jgi:hypothetical protein
MGRSKGKLRSYYFSYAIQYSSGRAGPFDFELSRNRFATAYVVVDQEVGV